MQKQGEFLALRHCNPIVIIVEVAPVINTIVSVNKEHQNHDKTKIFYYYRSIIEHIMH